MADDSVNEEQWLYGDSNPDKPEDQPEDSLTTSEKELQQFINPDGPDTTNAETTEAPDSTADSTSLNPPKPTETEDSQEQQDDSQDGGGNLQIDEDQDHNQENGQIAADEEDDDDDSDDDVNVVIGDIKTAPQYSSLNIKRGGLLTSGGPPQIKQPGKFSIDEFETIGAINGVPAHEFNLDNLEEKPWRKPGADITDYFNYGFNEETWRAYCERQKRMRIHESGVGLGPLGGGVTTAVAVAGRGGNMAMPIVNDNSKYASPTGVGPVLTRKAGPPPGRRVAGSIDVIGGTGLASRRTNESPPKENVIQVMTADRREYSRKGFPDMTLPPPAPGMQPAVFPICTPPPHLPASDGFTGNYANEFYSPDVDPYYQSYEPTQDLQWAASQGWQPSADVKIVVAATNVPPVSGSETSNQDSQDVRIKRSPSSASTVTVKQEVHSQEDAPKERERDRDRERHRERSHRHRSRSRSAERRSRKHKSRSRSPGHRSHKKKKSKKSDRPKEDSE